MIERIIEFSMRNRFIVIMAAVALAVLGNYWVHRTPIDAIPDLSENQVIVFTDWPGRSPREIEDQVTYPLSVNLQGLAGVKEVRSSSEFNFSMINIIFDEDVEFYFARDRVLERLTLASTFLPEGVTPYMAPDATALGQIFWYAVEGPGHSPADLRSLQDWFIKYQLNSVPGVAQVASIGGFPKEYQINVDPEKLRAFNVTIGQLYKAVQNSNSSVGGRVVHKNRAEYLVRGVGWITSEEDIADTVVTERNGVPILVKDVADVAIGSQFRRSILEMNGNEVVGAVVMMRYGENPLSVTQAIKDKIRELHKGLPEGVKIVPFYDRTPLITGAIHTVSRTLIEAILISTLTVMLILGHFRSAMVVSITLVLAVLSTFIFMGWYGIPSNIMSIAGLVISIGILVDPAIVMVENATHHLKKKFGDKKVSGDTTEELIAPCRKVGRPIFFAVLIMLVSFLPVFALEGMEGRMFHPLAFTKSFAMIAVALLSITLLPALLPTFIKGRLKREEESWIVRTFIEVYRPVLKFLLNKPKLVLWLFVALLAVGVLLFRGTGREFMPTLNEGTLMDMPISVPRLSVTQAADDLKYRDAIIMQFPEVENVIGKAGRADTPTDPAPLEMFESIINLRGKDIWPKRHLKYDDAMDENARIVKTLIKSGFTSGTISGDDRDSIAKAAMDPVSEFNSLMRAEALKKQLEFKLQLGKLSVKELALYVFDYLNASDAWKQKPSLEKRERIIGSIVNNHEQNLRNSPPLLFDIENATDALLRQLVSGGHIPSVSAALAADGGVLESSWRKLKSAAGFDVGDFYERLQKHVAAFQQRQWEERMEKIDWEIYDIGVPAYARFAAKDIRDALKARSLWNEKTTTKDFQKQVVALEKDFSRNAMLWRKDRELLLQELDTRVRVLGWSNIWTQPIINRIDMLATGVRTQVGIKVFGPDLQTIQDVSNQIAEVVRKVSGAVDVVADQSVGKGYIEIVIDRKQAARYGVNVGDIQQVIEIALGGKPITITVEGRERFPVRIRYARDFRVDEQSIKRLLVASSLPASAAKQSGGMSAGANGAGAMDQMKQVFMEDVADINVVEGPTMIKSENGLLRSYVQLNVRGRDLVGFVEEARRTVNQQVKMPEGTYVEWAGQFENQVRARKTLQVVFPAVILLIYLILYFTYKDFMDATLMMMAVPGALAGGIMFQHLFGYNFSVAVWVGYIACFGMATETGIIMLVYLREAIDERGGLSKIKSLGELRQSVIDGAVHRLRPKLLTEGTAILGLVPLLWADGVGAEVIKPMAAPVLGGLLVADEVIDVFLPVLFYHVRARRWRKIHNVGPETEFVLAEPAVT